jgi:hypothetical protein
MSDWADQVLIVRKTIWLEYGCVDVGLEVLKQLGHGILSMNDQMLFALLWYTLSVVWGKMLRIE